MNSKSIIACFVLLMTVGVQGCKKTNDIPDVADNGEYFNCMIDGKYWTYKQPSVYSMHDGLVAELDTVGYPFPFYLIQGDNVVDYPQTGIVFHIRGKSQPDKDTIDLVADSSGDWAEIHDPYKILDTITQAQYNSTDAYPGRLVFTERTSAHLEGTFYFDGYNYIDKKTVHVTNGRFRINIK